MGNNVTCYPENIMIQSGSAQAMALELIQNFSWVVIPKEILTDQGSPDYCKEVWWLLKVWSIKTLVFHPQTDGLIQ